MIPYMLTQKHVSKMVPFSMIVPEKVGLINQHKSSIQDEYSE